MKISCIYAQKKQPVSLEMFPPKGDLSIDEARAILGELAPLSPDFISVTCSAGGGGGTRTVELAHMARSEFGLEAMAHLTCINSGREDVRANIGQICERGLENVLALRGDRADGVCATDFKYASDLIPPLREAGLCVGAACYPEGHVECGSLSADMEHLVEKQAAGAEFLLSQLFFDNRSFYDFLARAVKAGITLPVSAGIMPIFSKSQISRMIFMCGASLPAPIIRLLNKYEQDEASLRAAGIDYAAQQAVDILKNTPCGVHIYTMNKPEAAAGILGRIRDAGYGRH